MAQSLAKSIAQAVSASLTAEAPVVSVTQSNLPKPRQTRKRTGAAPAAAAASTGTPERAATGDAPPHLDDRCCRP